jgi:hypothetical protein
MASTSDKNTPVILTNLARPCDGQVQALLNRAAPKRPSRSRRRCRAHGSITGVSWGTNRQRTWRGQSREQLERTYREWVMTQVRKTRSREQLERAHLKWVLSQARETWLEQEDQEWDPVFLRVDGTYDAPGVNSRGV